MPEKSFDISASKCAEFSTCTESTHCSTRIYSRQEKGEKVVIRSVDPKTTRMLQQREDRKEVETA
jgi:hypothetical protein